MATKKSTMGTATPESTPPPPPAPLHNGMRWCCISRGDIVLAEAGFDDNDDDDKSDGVVSRVARRIMNKPDTPGWDYHREKGGSTKSGLRGIKFHAITKDQSSTELTTWKFACVFDSNIRRRQAKSFLAQLVILTESYRLSDFGWKYGDRLSLQAFLAPILMQRMREVAPHLGKKAIVKDHDRSVKSKKVVAQNIELILEREGRHNPFFYPGPARQVRRFHMYQQAKRGWSKVP